MKFFKNWKTNVCGLVLLALLGLYLLNKITDVQIITSVTVVTAVFSFVAQDGNKKKDNRYYQ
ncbi:MAG: hypothetical protein WCO13_00640 [Bacteroidota bacterium]